MKRKFFDFALGVLTGAVLFGGATAVAAGIVAEPSWSPIFVDGRQVQMTAYNILGNNYVKLRDIGKEVGFNVYYQNGVQVDSDAPYTGEAPAKAEAQVSPVVTAEAVRVGCYKSGPLAVGDGTALMIYPGGIEYAVTSSNPAIATVERTAGQLWKVTAVSPGTARITAAAPDGRTGNVEVTVVGGSQPEGSGWSKDTSINLTANADIRQEMIRLINQTRRENGVKELAINTSLMDAAQDCSAQMFWKHNSEYECKAAMAYGYPYGFSANLTLFAGSEYMENVAQTAVSNWINSPGHFQTLLDAKCDTLGVGVTINNGQACCYMFAGDPNSHHPYE